ncbi:MAG: hypothetical protein ACP5DX_04670 [Paracoccaceae bacterium]
MNLNQPFKGGSTLPNQETKTQLDKFKEAARQLETDDDDERFEKKLKKLVKQKLDAKKTEARDE